MIIQSLITDAIYKSLQDREHQPQINSGYANFALYELNYILDEWRDLIPFSQEFVFTNVDDLADTNFVSVSNVNFVLNNVSAELPPITLTEYMRISQVTNLRSIPTCYYFDQLKQTIRVYPIPNNQPYLFIVWARVADRPVTMFDEIPLQVTPFMQNALVYELAKRLCEEYGVDWPEGKESTRVKLYSLLQGKRSVDLKPAANIVFGLPNVSQVPPFPYFYAISGGTFS